MNEFGYLLNSKCFNKKKVLMPFCHQSTFVKSKILKERKFSVNYRLSSDFDFFIDCFLKKKNSKELKKLFPK